MLSRPSRFAPSRRQSEGFRKGHLGLPALRLVAASEQPAAHLTHTSLANQRRSPGRDTAKAKRCANKYSSSSNRDLSAALLPSGVAFTAGASGGV